ncbi:MAG TPA: anti-sigma regulatory factor [Desulfobacteraceae bacterium]|nr:MAG: anti-sigma regulatory factor [Deltaproteobacteria bacterium]HDL08329.1 anti-sigma regulatory factor [Desulfobacteraceae bacterium]
MTALIKSYHIKKRDFIRAGEASINVQNLLKSLSFDSNLIRRVAICGYEGEMNVVMHGGDGLLSVEINSGKIVMVISDNGAGIEDIDLAMRKGFSTASDEYRKMGFGAGMGLPNMKKNADIFNIESEKGKGTEVRMIFSMRKEGG